MSYLPFVQLLKTAGRIYRKFDRLPEAMRCAMQLNDVELMNQLFFAAADKDLLVQKQLAFMLGTSADNDFASVHIC